MLCLWNSHKEFDELRRYYKVLEAKSAPVVNGNDRLWACYRMKSNGKLGKYFVVASIWKFYNYIYQDHVSLNWYKIILKNHGCLFYLDIEVPTVIQTQYSVGECQLLERPICYIFPDITSVDTDPVLQKYFRLASEDWTDNVCTNLKPGLLILMHAKNKDTICYY